MAASPDGFKKTNDENTEMMVEMTNSNHNAPLKDVKSLSRLSSFLQVGDRVNTNHESKRSALSIRNKILVRPEKLLKQSQLGAMSARSIHQPGSSTTRKNYNPISERRMSSGIPKRDFYLPKPF